MSSIQFRSRIKPALNYGDTLNSYGVCCGVSGNTKQYKSYIECFNEGGHFIPTFGNDNIESIACPDSDTQFGCCCACSYTSPNDYSLLPPLTTTGDVAPGYTPYLASGIRGNVSKCECDRVGGKWTAGECPSELTNDNWKPLCVKGITTDVRVARSCCHVEVDAFGAPQNIVCTNTCSAQDCGNLGSFTYPAVFGNSRCDIPVIEGEDTAVCTSGLSPSIIATKTSTYENVPIGSCYTLDTVDNELKYNCTLSPERLCSGYWVEARDESNSYCSSSYRPTDPVSVNGVYQPQTMTESAFNALGLTSGNKFQGGIYIGTFSTPNAPSTSEVFGNLQFGKPSLSKYYADSVGLTYEKWAIIVDTKTYAISLFTENDRIVDYTTSLWDGYYNIYGNNTNFFGINTNTVNTIKYQNRAGFIDYYIPSIYELFFYAKYLRQSNITNIGILLSSSIFNTKYLNSSNKSILNNTQYVYGLSVLSDLNTIEENYKTVLVDINTLQRVSFFRRIILT